MSSVESMPTSGSGTAPAATVPPVALATVLPPALPAGARRPEPFTLSIVVPVFNEEASLDAFFAALLPEIDRSGAQAAEVICIDDGSADASAEAVVRHARQDPRIKLLALTRNFGKEAALSAGIDHASGDAVIAIDADLQHPPDLIGPMIERWREGYDIVAAMRTDRGTDGLLRRMVSQGFYNVFNRIAEREIPQEIGDFRLMDAAVVRALRTLPERNRFMKGLFAWVGFRGATIPYDVQPRVGGTSAFGFWRLWNFALDGITAFSTWPLRVWSYLGLVIALISLVYAGAIVISTIIYGVDVPGFASLIVLILFLGAVQLISLGVLGEYIGRIMVEVKLRPVYLVGRVFSADGNDPKPGSREGSSPTGAGAEKAGPDDG